MSKIIKGCRIEYNSVPRVIVTVPRDNKSGNKDNLTGIGLDTDELTLKDAVQRAAEVTEQARMEGMIAYAAAHKCGRQNGFPEGLKKGSEEGGKRAREQLRLTVEDFVARANALDGIYTKNMENAKMECTDFAFSLAENILGMPIDREDEKFRAAIDSFMKSKPHAATLCVDGESCGLKTLRPDLLAAAAEGIEGVSMQILPDAAEKAKIAAEIKTATPEKPDAAETEANLTEQSGEPEGALQTVMPEAEELAAASRAEPVPKEQTEVAVEETEAAVEAELPDEPLGTWQREISESEQEFTEPEDFDSSEELSAAFDNSETSAEEESICELPDEKLVYVRPAVKAAMLPSDGAFTFENIVALGTDDLKTFVRKAGVQDLTTALQGAPEETVSAILNACPRRTREKVLDAMKYLGPAPESETLKVRAALARLAGEIAGFSANGGDAVV